MRATLLVMAAGLGARYGGNKQIDKMGPKGQILMEYSIYDALEAGFDKVVFVIKKSMADVFREMVENRIAKKVDVCYAFQEYDSLPSNFMPPQDRTKPYGTVHAVLCTKGLIHEPFAVINADDYYGREHLQPCEIPYINCPQKGMRLWWDISCKTLYQKTAL
jgi:UTP-glucose-1-phosphate uridylyltransferase